jgi:hypothetical protein
MVSGDPQRRLRRQAGAIPQLQDERFSSRRTIKAISPREPASASSRTRVSG